MPATISEKLASSGPDVSTWQGLLSAAGYAVDASGVFDAATDAATRAWQAAKGLVSDGVVGPASWSAMTGTPAYQTDSHAAFGRQTLLNVWKDVTGEDPNLASLQIAGAQAKLESNYGLSSYTNKQTGETSGPINNWGAVQGQPGFLASDVHADGTPYTAYYKKYDTPEAGAADMLKEMTVRRPTSWQHMREGDIDAWAQSMRVKDPISKVLGYFEQAWEDRAKGIDMRVLNIAGTLGEPIAAKRGGPVPPDVAAGTEPSPGEAGGAAGDQSGWLVGGVVAAALAAVAWYFRKKWWPF